MTQAPTPEKQSPSQAGAGLPAAPVRRRLVALALVVLLAAAGVAGLLWYQRPQPIVLPEPEAAEVPTVSTSGIDAAVARVIDQARANVVQDPRSGPSWGRLGMVLAAHSFTREAHVCFREAERLDPQEPRWPYYQAYFPEVRDPEGALAALERTVALCGDNPDAPRLRLAEALREAGRDDEAAVQLEHLLQVRPGHPRAEMELGRLALQTGNLTEAVEHLRRAARDRSTRKAATELLGQALLRQGNRAGAQAQSRRAASLPDDPPWSDPFSDQVARLVTGEKVGYDRANTLLDRGRAVEAIALLERLVDEYPRSEWARLLLGKAHLKNRDLPAAERVLQEAVELAPDSVEIQRHLGLALWAQKKYAPAADCFRKVAASKAEAPAHYLLGLCQKGQGQWKEAVESFRAALRFQPDHVNARLELGEVLAEHGQDAEARAQLREALKIDPTNPRARYLLDRLAPPGQEKEQAAPEKP